MQWLRLYHDTINDPKWRVISVRSKQPVGNVLAVWMQMLISASEATQRGTLEGWDDETSAAVLGYDPEAVTAIREAMQGRVLDGLRLTGWDKRQFPSDTSAERTRRYRAKNAGGDGGDGGGSSQKTNGAYGRHSDDHVTSQKETVTSQTENVTVNVTSPPLRATDLQNRRVVENSTRPLHTHDEPIAPLRGAEGKVAFVGSTFKFSAQTVAALAERYPAIPELTKTLGAYDLALAGKPNAYGELHVKLLHEDNYHSAHAARRSAPPKSSPVSPALQDRSGIRNALHAKRAANHG